MEKDIEGMSPRELVQAKLDVELELRQIRGLVHQDEIPSVEFPKYQARWDQLQEHRSRIIALISSQH